MEPSDQVFARLAVARGWVSEQTIRATLEELKRAAAETKTSLGGSTLATALRERGLINDAQMRALMVEQVRHLRTVEHFSDVRQTDEAFGRLLAERGFVPEPRVAEALYVQRMEREQGRVRRLGDILLDRGAITRDALLVALEKSGVRALSCPACGTTAPPDPASPASPLACAECGGPLVDDQTLASMRRERPALPDEVRIAAEMPERQYGKFVLVQHLGTGGMGAVWKAWDQDLGRYVAIKFLRSVRDPIKRDEEIRRFLREASVVARLRHPNIVTVYEAGEIRDQQCIVMEYIDGKPLNHLRLSPRRSLEVLRDSARAVQYAHDQGVVHRDLKPGNIMVTPDGKVFVMDFGLARSLEGPSDLTQSGIVLGTPMYMPPEQAQAVRDRNEKLCDVYSLGATLYDMLTGRPPFEADEPWDVIGQVIHQEPLAPRARNPEVPRDAETITLKAMAKDVAARYPSAAELAEDVDRYLRGEAIIARPAPLPERAWRWTKRHRAGVMAGVAIAAVLVAGAAVVWAVQTRGQRRDAETARQLVVEAREALDLFRGLRAILTQRRGALTALPEDAPREDRRKLEREVHDTKESLEKAFGDVVGHCTAALALVAGQADAHAALGDAFWERFLLAEEEEDDVRSHASMVRAYAGGRYGAQLDAQATLWLTSEPSGAVAEYYPYVTAKDGRLMPGEVRPLGRTPLEGSILPRGSGLIVLRKEGRVDTRLPVLARRQQELRLSVKLYTSAQIGEGFVHVPAGTFIFGGDASAVRERERAEIHVDDLFIGLHEVTWREYVEFLNSIEPDAAGRHAPKARSGQLLMLQIVGDKYVCPDEWQDVPASNIMWGDARAYCEWRSGRDRREYRLPSATEWEKAARGVDGRAYPWGNEFDWSFTWGARSRSEPPGRPVAVGSVAADRSPYGVCDMGGNVGEWCLDEVVIFEGRVGHEIRGGWYAVDYAGAFRCASRQRSQDEIRQSTLGFRVVTAAR